MKTIKRLLTILSLFLLTSCGVNWHVSTINHDPIYGTITVADDVEVDTITSRWDFERKLRTDFNFRWDYANYMMTRPMSFYWRNWRGGMGNVHDFYWNSHQIWTDWAFNYPFTSFNSWYWDRWDPWPRWRHNRWWGYNGGWYANTWNNHWYQYGYSGWYGHDSMLWGSQWNRRGNANYAYINGPRGSRANLDTNSNIQNVVSNRRNSNNNVNSRGPRISNTENGIIIRNGNNIRVIPNNNIRVYNNPNNVPNRVIKPRNNNNINWNNNNNNNNIRVNPPSNNNNNVRGSWRPSNNNSNTRSSSPPVINNGGSSRGSSGSGSSSVGSSRGSRGNN